LGAVLQQTGRRSEAIEQFEQALKINPGDAKAHYNLGAVLQQTGRFSEATQQFDQALKLSIEHGE
jgi:Flp pilus assembly protein TadD